MNTPQNYGNYEPKDDEALVAHLSLAEPADTSNTPTDFTDYKITDLFANRAVLRQKARIEKSLSGTTK